MYRIVFLILICFFSFDAIANSSDSTKIKPRKLTYSDFKEMGTKVDNIIISLLEFKEKVKEIQKKKERANLVLKVTDNITTKMD